MAVWFDTKFFLAHQCSDCGLELYFLNLASRIVTGSTGRSGLPDLGIDRLEGERRVEVCQPGMSG